MSENVNDGWNHERALTRDDDGNYVKKLTERQRQYYERYGNIIMAYHAPYRFINDVNEPKIIMEEYGRAINKYDEGGKQFALNALKDLHSKGVYHGDILSESIGTGVKLNIGNILENNNNYKLIDFGPIGDDIRSDEELLNMEKQLLQGYKRGPPSVKRKRRRPNMDNDRKVGKKLFFGGMKKGKINKRGKTMKKGKTRKYKKSMKKGKTRKYKKSMKKGKKGRK